MNRREAFKAAAVVGLAVASVSLARGVGSNAAAPAAVSGRLVQGATGGRVLESVDGGASWQCVARLGEQCAVRSIAERDGVLHARIETQGHAFVLWSRDARTWRTLDARESAL